MVYGCAKQMAYAVPVAVPPSTVLAMTLHDVVLDGKLALDERMDVVLLVVHPPPITSSPALQFALMFVSVPVMLVAVPVRIVTSPPAGPTGPWGPAAP